MQEDIFRSVVHRSLSRSLKPRERDRDRKQSNESVQYETNIRPNKSLSSLSIQTSILAKINQKEGENKKQRAAMALRDRAELNIIKTYGSVINKSGSRNFEKIFAESLLKGAMDLEESLSMLESFQANVNKKKRKPEIRKQRVGDGGEIQEVFVEGNKANNKLFLSNGSSRSSTDGLKKVIKESLYKQNLITISSDDENGSLSRSFRGTNNHNNNNNNCQSIVAKLMGLEDVPMDLDNFDLVRGDEKMRNVSSPRAMFDIERMPKVRKIPIIEEKLDPNRKALQEIMETIQFKGLMKSNQEEKEEIEKGLDEDVISIKMEDHSAKLATKDQGHVVVKSIERNEVKNIEKTKVESSEKSSRKQQKTERAKNTKTKPSVEKKPVSSAKKSDEKKDLKALKMVKNSEKKIVGTSNGASSSRIMNPVSNTSSTVLVKEKKQMVNKKNGTCTTTGVHKKGKEERKTSSSKNQKNGVSTYNHTLISHDKSKQKQDPAPSMEDDLSGDSSISCGVKEEKDEDLKLLLYRNKSFRCNAKELSKGKVENLKLYLDFAGEIMARKNLQKDLFYPPFHIQIWRRTPYFSIEKLATEIHNGFRKVSGYSVLDKQERSKDSLYVKLERDLRCSDSAVNSMWDFGWLDFVCTEETGRVVSEIGENMLCSLIEEVLLDLVF